MSYPDYQAIIEWHEPPPAAELIERAWQMLMDPKIVRGGVPGPGRLWDDCRRWLVANRERHGGGRRK